MSFILDSSLRDGAYAFGNSMPTAYVDNISKHLDGIVDYLEVGSPLSFGYGSENTLEDDLSRLNTVSTNLKHTRSAVFLQPHLWEAVNADIKDVFMHKPGLIRIGLDPEIEPSIERHLIEQCSANNIPCALNLMKIHKYSASRLEYIVSLVELGVECVSIVDSSGCMKPDEIMHLLARCSRIFRSNLGVHIHDNSGLANSISIQSLQRGVYVDSTLLGKGRAGGNADTCLLVLQREMMNNMSLSYINTTLYKLLHATTLIWGHEAREHLTDILLGLTSMHSSRLSSGRFKSLDMIPSINSMIDVAWNG